MRTMGLLLIVAAAAAGCGGDETADVAGDYTIALTNRDNGCNLANWTVGDSTTGVSVTITQDGSNATAVVNGAAGLVLQAWLGSKSFVGSVDGSHVDLTILGSNANTSGNCTYTYNAEILGSLDGDVLTGRINYTAATNDNPDCAAIEGCVSYQEFNGTRPPSP